MDFTIEQKWEILNNLSSVSVKLRDPKNRSNENSKYYASFDGLVEIVGDGLARSIHGNGFTPNLAINSLWQQITGLTDELYLRAGKDEVRWNGFYFERVN